MGSLLPLCKNGVDFVGDLLDDNGNILDDFKLKYKVNTTFLEFGGLIVAIKRSFPNLFNSSDDVLIRPFKPFNFDVILKDSKGSRRIYNILISSKKSVSMSSSGRISFVIFTTPKSGPSSLICRLNVLLIQS